MATMLGLSTKTRDITGGQAKKLEPSLRFHYLLDCLFVTANAGNPERLCVISHSLRDETGDWSVFSCAMAGPGSLPFVESE